MIQSANCECHSPTNAFQRFQLIRHNTKSRNENLNINLLYYIDIDSQECLPNIHLTHK